MEDDVTKDSQTENRRVGFQSHHTKAEITKLETRVEYLEAELEAKKLIDEKNIPETKEVLR